MSDWSLTTRTGLPEHLRLLVESYPREAWERHANFNALTQFWLERHLMFRQALAQMSSDAAAFLDRDVESKLFGTKIYRLGSFFLGHLHEHHHIEDEHYFPMLAQHDSRLSRAFDLLDADHLALGEYLQTMTHDINGVLGALQSNSAAEVETGRYQATLGDVDKLLDRHLFDEEEIIIPLLLEHGG